MQPNYFHVATALARRQFPVPVHVADARAFAEQEANTYPLPDPQEKVTPLPIHMQNFAEMLKDLRLAISTADPSELAPLKRLVVELRDQLHETLTLVCSRTEKPWAPEDHDY